MTHSARGSAATRKSRKQLCTFPGLLVATTIYYRFEPTKRFAHFSYTFDSLDLHERTVAYVSRARATPVDIIAARNRHAAVALAASTIAATKGETRDNHREKDTTVHFAFFQRNFPSPFSTPPNMHHLHGISFLSVPFFFPFLATLLLFFLIFLFQELIRDAIKPPASTVRL